MDTTQEELKKHDQVKAIGFVAVIAIVGAFIAFMSWVWGRSEPFVRPDSAISGHSEPVISEPGAHHVEVEPEQRQTYIRPQRIESSQGMRVSVSHPQLLEPGVGTEIEGGVTKFSGVAEAGTKVVLYAQGLDIGHGLVGDDGKFAFEVNLSESNQGKYSLKYFSEEGKLIEKVEDLGLKIFGQNAPTED